MYIQFRPPLRQPANDVGQEIGRNRGDHPQPQAPGESAPCRTGHIAQFLDRSQHVLRPAVKLFAKPGQPHLARGPFEKLHTQRVLQFPDLHGQGRLGYGTGLGGVAEMAMPRERLEIAQLTQGDIDHKKKLSSR